MSWPKILKNHHFEVLSSPSLCNNNEPFLDWIVTWDEKWILYENQRRPAQWLDKEETLKYFPKPSESCSVVSNSLRPHVLHSPWNSPGQNTGVGSHSLLQGIFPTQGSNPGLLHCSQFFTSWATREAPQSQICTKKRSWPLFGVFCCQSDPLQLSESQRNHYIWEVCSANRWDALKTAMPAAGIGHQKGPNSFAWQCPITGHTTNTSTFESTLKSWMNWAMKFCLIWPLNNRLPFL